MRQAWKRGCAVVIACIAILGCAQTPQQSVELSSTIGRDLLELHRAHRELASRYFDRSIQDVNTFVDTKYRPFIIQSTINDPQLDFRARLARSLEPGATPDAVRFMGTYANGVINRVEAFRKELVTPVQRRKEEALAQIDASYQQVILANAAVTGHLASVVKVTDVQNQVLSQLQLKDLRDRTLAEVVAFSDKVSELTAEGERVDAQTAQGAAEIQRIADRLRALFR
ncbi:MAG TPA: hypothetical protein VHM01_15535 [Alphaproteobacteria bacterium]|nr:hypothetical protein [Alphaproteobacteria bacterium]